MSRLAKYGEAFSFEVPMVKAGDMDLAATGDWTPVTGDVKVSKDGAAVANITTLPTAVTGTGSVLWTFALSATEMQAARVTIQVVDPATKAVEPTVFDVFTYGNASAQHAFDMDTANVTVGAFAANAITAAAINTGAITSAKFAAGAINAAALNADARTFIFNKVVEDAGSYTAQQVLSIALSVLAGETNTGGTIFRTPNDTATRVTATVDASDNRTTMTLTPSAGA